MLDAHFNIKVCDFGKTQVILGLNIRSLNVLRLFSFQKEDLRKGLGSGMRGSKSKDPGHLQLNSLLQGP